MQFPRTTKSLLRNFFSVLAAGISAVACIALDFEVPFYIPGSGTVTNRAFNTTNGPEDGQRLLTGVRLVPSGDGIFVGIDRSTVWSVSPVGELVVESATHPELADWAMGLAFNSASQRAVLVTLGGEGAVYQRDSGSGVWSRVASMQNEDLESLVYLPEDNCYYGIRVYNGAPSAPAALLKYSAEGEKLGEIQLPPFPVNLSPGNHTAKLEALEGKIVALVERVPEMSLQTGDRSRIYVIDPTTGTMDLTFDHLAVAPQIGFSITPKFASTLVQGIPIHVTAFVENGAASSLAFYDGDQKIADGIKSTNTPPNFSFVWANPPVGQRALKAVGMTKSAETFSSRILSFTVVPATNAPTLRITFPTTNDMIFVGDHVRTVVEVSDRDNNLRSLSINRGVNQGLTFDPPPIGTNKYTFDWIADRQGLASLTATARDGAGLKNASILQLNILDPNQFVRRYLPTSYVRGKGFTVRLTARPGTNIHAWAVEEHPPQGWIVQPETWDGVYNRSNNIIKWGPFTDLQVRDLMYWVIPPTNATGAKDFSGQVSANGASTQIVGDFRISDVLPFHPADVSRDNRITVDELTAYAAAWKTASTWSNGPVPIPVDYVTRAGMIWKSTEVYTFNAALPAPACWVPQQLSHLAAAALLTASEVTRVLAPALTPGVATTVTIDVHPAADTQAYAIEERLPKGWVVVDGEGTLGLDGVLRFGPFFDAQTRTLTYRAVPTASVVGEFYGVASFDGANQPIAGALVTGLTTSIAETRNGQVYLHLHGTVGQQYVLESAGSIGSADWKMEMMVSGADSAIDVPAFEPSENQRFYRLRPVSP